MTHFITRRHLAMFCMALMLGTTAVAQDHQRGGRGQRGDMTERMKTELGLSDEQVAQLKEVYSQMRPSQQGERPSRGEMLDSVSSDGFSIEEAHWLYMRAMEWANGDKFYIHFGHEDNIVSDGELEKVNLIVLK